MAFDPLSDTFALEADLDPHGAALLAGASIALAQDTGQWWSHLVIPCERTFREVERFGDPDIDICSSGKAACHLLLLMREALRQG